VEVFVNDGSMVFTNQVFPKPGHNAIEFFSRHKKSVFSDISFWKMKSVW
jgi:sucrose-6-phosphate hydrolase SacC (GH32 family)